MSNKNRVGRYEIFFLHRHSLYRKGMLTLTVLVQKSLGWHQKLGLVARATGNKGVFLGVFLFCLPHQSN